MPAQMPTSKCFVIMPVSDPPTYSSGHFTRVFEHLIAPACKQAGFEPVLTSDRRHTHVIPLDILRHLLESDMALCDLSSRNPNVMYELGFRQAFNKPVTLIRDNLTERIFDVQFIRDVEYDSSLRIEVVEKAIPVVADTLKNTYEGSRNGTADINSLVQVLGIQAARVPEARSVGQDTAIVLQRLEAISERITAVEANTRRAGGEAVSATGFVINPDVGYFGVGGGTQKGLLPYLLTTYPSTGSLTSDITASPGKPLAVVTNPLASGGLTGGQPSESGEK
jgi:hypothetical protein